MSTASALTIREARAALAGRLHARLAEIEAALATRVYAISEPRESADPEYPQALRAALRAALSYALQAIECGERRTPAVPVSLLTQARLAARNDISLDTVLRRYFAGYSLLTEYVVQEAERGELLGNASIEAVVRGQAAVFDRLIAAVAEEHASEQRRRPLNSAERRRESIERLLAGEHIDHSELSYDLEGHHLAIVARGEGAEQILRELATRLDRRLLAVPRGREPLCACWLGGRRRLAAEQALQELHGFAPDRLFVALGEPAEGLSGWRLSHLQAKAALPIAERARSPIVRYADVALLASISRDDLLIESLRKLYLEPLRSERDGGEFAKRALRAYFAAGCNASSAASALGVSRQTINRRLQAVEDELGRPLHSCALDIQVALYSEGL